MSNSRKVIDDLRWACVGLELLYNGLSNRRKLLPNDIEMINLKAVRTSVNSALTALKKGKR